MKEVSMWTISDNKNWSYLENKFQWVQRMQLVPQDARHHAEGNVAVHTQMVLTELQQLPAYQQLQQQEKEILFASALLHDVEKYSTTVTEPDGSITSAGHAKKGAFTTRQILYRDEPAPFAIREQIVALVRYHGLPLWIFEKKDPLRTLIRTSLDVNTQWLALLARADALGRICTDRQELLYRIDCFEEFCREHNCWGHTRPFATDHARLHYLQKDDSHVDYIPFDQPKMEVIMMSGLPGAGKDSFIKKHFNGMPVISLDAIRQDWDIDPTDKTGNGQVIQEAKEQARSFLRRQKGFIWNATNTTLSMRQQLTDLFTTYRAMVRIIYIEAPYANLFKQNNQREAVVPMPVIEKLISKLEVPALWEAHQVNWQVT